MRKRMLGGKGSVMGSAYDLSGLVLDTYSRISEDHEDLQTGVTNQRRSNRELIEAAGGEVGVEHVENDTTAFKKKRITVIDEHTGQPRTAYRVVRPVWAKALERLRNGEVDGLVVYDLDRLARDPRDLEDAIEVVESFGKRIISSTAAEMDLSTTNGTMMARFMVIMANKSSADTSRRVKFAAKGRALEGKVAGRRSFGWAEDRLALHPTEAPLVREAVKGLIAGTTNPTRIAREWTEQGVMTARGNAWTGITLRQYLRHPRLCGYRVYWPDVESKESAQPLLDNDGSVVLGEWEPILTPEEFAALQVILTPKSVDVVKPFARRDYLISGLLHCGKCYGRMYANSMKSQKSHYYRCTKHSSGPTKHTLVIQGTHVDNHVTAQVHERLKALSETAQRSEVKKVWAGEAEYARVQEDLAAYQQAHLAGDITFTEYQAFSGVKKARKKELEAERSAFEVERKKSRPVATDEILRRWDSEGNEWRRKVIETLVETIIVHPKDPSEPRSKFNPDRIDIRYW